MRLPWRFPYVAETAEFEVVIADLLVCSIKGEVKKKHDGQAAISPQLPLGAKTMRRLQNAQQHRRPDWTKRGNLAEPFPSLLFLALDEQIPPHSLAQHSQCI